MATNVRRFSPWWLVGVGIVTIILFGVGRGMIYCYNFDSTDACGFGSYIAGVGFLSVGSTTSLAWTALFVTYLKSRRPQMQ